MKKYVSMTDMAKRYGYTLNAIKSWRAEGLNYDDKKGIPEDEGTVWIVQNKINPMRNMSVRDEMEKEKLREQTAKADLATIAVREKSGELIAVEQVQSELNQFCQTLKDNMRLIPNKHGIEILESAGSISELKETLKAVIDGALNELGDLFDQEIEDETITETVEAESEIDIDLN